MGRVFNVRNLLIHLSSNGNAAFLPNLPEEFRWLSKGMEPPNSITLEQVRTFESLLLAFVAKNIPTNPDYFQPPFVAFMRAVLNLGAYPFRRDELTIFTYPLRGGLRGSIGGATTQFAFMLDHHVNKGPATLRAINVAAFGLKPDQLLTFSERLQALQIEAQATEVSLQVALSNMATRLAPIVWGRNVTNSARTVLGKAISASRSFPDLIKDNEFATRSMGYTDSRAGTTNSQGRFVSFAAGA